MAVPTRTEVEALSGADLELVAGGVCWSDAVNCGCTI